MRVVSPDRDCAARSLHNDPVWGYEAAVDSGTAWIIECGSGERHAVVVPNVTVAEVIAAGANGIVFVGEDVIGRRVTVKVWPPRLRPRRSLDRAQAQALAEAKKVALLKHPRIASVHHIGTLSNGWPYTVAQYVPGVPLRDVRGSLGVRARHAVMAGVLQALEYAEAAGMLHGDLHDRNVVIDGIDPYVIDFGTSAFVDGADSEARHARLLREFVWTLLPELSDYLRPVTSLDGRHGSAMLPVLRRATSFVLMIFQDREPPDDIRIVGMPPKEKLHPTVLGTFLAGLLDFDLQFLFDRLAETYTEAELNEMKGYLTATLAGFSGTVPAEQPYLDAALASKLAEHGVTWTPSSRPLPRGAVTVKQRPSPTRR